MFRRRWAHARLRFFYACDLIGEGESAAVSVVGAVGYVSIVSIVNHVIVVITLISFFCLL